MVVLDRHAGVARLLERARALGSKHTADCAYVRLHEGTSSRRPCYGVAALRWWVRALAAAPANVQEGWVFFNNDPQGCTPVNAATFGRMTERAGLAVPSTPRRSGAARFAPKAEG